MRVAAPLLCAALAAGCGHAAVGVSSGAQATTAASAGGASITTSSGAAALGLVLFFGVIDYANNPQPFPSPADLVSPNPSRIPPDMAAGRRIAEQDCSKPVDLTLGNLRCR